MITEEKIQRINELSRKSKTAEGLTEAEKKEQEVLRREYVDSFKANLKAQLDQIRIVDDEDNLEEIEKELDEMESELEEVKDALKE